MVLVALLLAATPLPAHSHNDYSRPEPLAAALRAGFQSVEADVFLQGGEIRVAHDAKDLVPGRTLSKLYLEPLRKNPPPYPLILMVDVKSAQALDGHETLYHALRKELLRFTTILTRWENGKRIHGRVTVILSGARPIDEVRAETLRYVGIDGRLPDLRAENFDPELMPMVSDNWALAFGWSSASPLPPEKEAVLRELCDLAKKRGTLLRFWASPDRPEIWRQQRDAGVGLIGTDRVAELSEFLSKEASASAVQRP